nr:hypothetical protein [Tanacetum cinerariifolium]
MSYSTISSKSLAESTGSLPLPVVLHPAPVVDSESEPFEDLASPVISDSDSFVNPLNSEPFEDRVSPDVSVEFDSDVEPLGSPATYDYYGGFEFSKEDPLEEDSLNASTETDESPSAQAVPAIATQSPPALSLPIAPYKPRGTVQGPRKTVRKHITVSLYRKMMKEII